MVLLLMFTLSAFPMFTCVDAAPEMVLLPMSNMAPEK